MSSFKQIVIVLSVVFLIFPHFALAQPITPGCEILTSEEMEAIGINTKTYKPIVINFSLTGVTTEVDNNGKTEYQVKNLQCFIIGIYVYLSGVAGILATVMIMYGGVKYVISMGNPSKMGDAKDTIFSAVVGLVLVLGAYVLLNLINPNLTSLRVPGLNIASIAPVPTACTANATPLIEDHTICGYLGTEIIVQDNPNTDKDETVEVDCMYTGCNPSSNVCAQGSPTDPDVNRGKWYCMTPKQRCERVTFYNDSADLIGSNVELCIPLSIPDKGVCKWLDRPISDIWNSDQCIWYTPVLCTIHASNLDRVDCARCNAVGVECKKLGSTRVNCLADADQTIYFSYGSSVNGQDQGVCCHFEWTGNDYVTCYNGHSSVPGIQE